MFMILGGSHTTQMVEQAIYMVWNGCRDVLSLLPMKKPMDKSDSLSAMDTKVTSPVILLCIVFKTVSFL